MSITKNRLQQIIDKAREKVVRQTVCRSRVLERQGIMDLQY